MRLARHGRLRRLKVLGTALRFDRDDVLVRLMVDGQPMPAFGETLRLCTGPAG